MTKVFDAILFVYVILALMKGAVQTLHGVEVSLLNFFWGMLIIIVSLVILIGQPETWPCLAITLIVTALAIVSLVNVRRTNTNPMRG